MNLQLSSHAISEGESLTLMISDHPALTNAISLGIELYSVEQAETTFRLGTTLPATVFDGKLKATIDENVAATALGSGLLVEVAALQLVDAEGSVAARMTGSTDFPRTFFRIKASPNEPSLTPEQAAEIAREVERNREEMYAEPLGDPGSVDAKEFRVLMFVERLLLTQLLRVPGVQVFPLIESEHPVRKSFGLGGAEELEFINQVLRDMNWIVPQASIDRSWWREENSRKRPVALMYVPRVFAANENHALWISHGRRDSLLRLLAFHRNYSGVPFATAIQWLDPATSRYGEVHVYPEVEQYTGNLIGGFLSGESQSLLLANYKAMLSKPFLSFVLHLHAEAQAEKDLDFAYFRYWNLLETIAAERVEKGTPVTDFDGALILKANDKPFKTDGARGRVYELVKRSMQAQNHKENFHQEARDLAIGLWDAVYVWYGFRNATAHHGGFNPEDPNQQQQSWYKTAVEAQRNGAQPSGYEYDPYFGYLKSVTTNLIRGETELARKG